MSLLDTNYQDQRLTSSQKKKIKPAIQGGGYNYLGEQEEVTVPKKWLSDPDHVVAELAYITPREKKILLDIDLYGSLDGKPNNAPGGLDSLQGDMGTISRSSGGGTGNTTGGSSSGGNDNSNDNREQYGAFTQYTTTPQAMGTVDAEDEYLAPDKDHWKATQKAIKKFQKGDNYQADYSDWSKESREAYQLEMNKLKGTKGKNYSFYKGNEGTTNLSFNEHWKDVAATNPFLANIPIARLLIAAGRTLQENFTTDYGTARYGGAGTDGSSLRAIDGGGWFGMLFNSDGTVKENLTNDDYDRIYNAALPDLPYLVGGSQPQETSMVNEYFNNMNMNQGSPLSSNLQTDYNNAKNSINSILGVLPPSQQFGYSADPYGGLMSSNLTTNPFNIDYLRRLGLI